MFINIYCCKGCDKSVQIFVLIKPIGLYDTCSAE